MNSIVYVLSECKGAFRTKLDDLKSAIMVSAVCFDIIILVETWLNSSISTPELGLSGYNVFRKDRSHLSFLGEEVSSLPSGILCPVL